MYQAFVLILVGLLIGGSLYFIREAGSGGSQLVLTSQVTDHAQGSDVTVDTVPGTYGCDSMSGCKDESTLKLTSDGDARLSSSFENGAEVVEEKGSWLFAQDGTMQILITGTDSETYGLPRIFFIRKVLSEALSGLQFDTKLYSGWTNPVFTKER
ncbi:MAG: hypothetical protein RIQ41_441 [Candidatus Parcubacteria bacterium]|jgi:hypothetical protein